MISVGNSAEIFPILTVKKLSKLQFQH
jgi:hypothetical protein